MSKRVSRQAGWQRANPEKQRLLRKQTEVRKRYSLLQQGYVKTHDEIYDMIADYEKRTGEIDGREWWLIFEYLDWKYNGSKYTDLTMDRKLGLL